MLTGQNPGYQEACCDATKCSNNCTQRDGPPPIIQCSFASFLKKTRLNNIKGRQKGVWYLFYISLKLIDWIKPFLSESRVSVLDLYQEKGSSQVEEMLYYQPSSIKVAE